METIKLYHCSCCGEDYPGTEEFYNPSALKLATKNPNRTSLGYCRPCTTTRNQKYIQKKKDTGLSRRGNARVPVIVGKLYVIGISEEHPFKIGITSGTSIDKRITALQTSHWLDLKIFYESTVIQDPGKIERALHKHYDDKKVRGEWFDINVKDIDYIKGFVDTSLNQYQGVK
jgi:hypothetical protein